MSWHYVSATGDALGPVGVQELQSKYESGAINDETYVWNGAEVSQWTPINKVSSLYAQVKPTAIPKPPPSGPIGGPPRRAVISAPRSIVSQPKQPEGEGEGEGNPGVGSAKTAMLGQMSAALKNRSAPKMPTTTTTTTTTTITATTTPINPPTAKTVAPITKAPTNPSPTIPKKETTSPSNPRGMLMKKNTLKSIDPEPKSPETNGTSEDPRMERIKNSLSGAQEWQLRAIEKLLS